MHADTPLERLCGAMDRFNSPMTNQFCELSRNHPDRVRNISIIAHVDHGKTTLTDYLLSHNDIIGKGSAGKLQFMDSRQDEMERFITINASSVSLTYKPTKPVQFPSLTGKNPAGLRDSAAYPYVESGDENQLHLVNLIDCPGHQDFLSEVDASVKVSDGCIIVVDAVEGVKAQTKAVLATAWRHGCSVVLAINKIDRLFQELYLSPKEAYDAINLIFQDIGVVMGECLMSESLKRENCQSNELDDDIEAAEVPEFTRGKVVLCSARHGWATTIIPFADIFAKRSKMNSVDTATICEHLWGPFAWNPKETRFQKITSASSMSSALGISIVMTILHTIYENWDDATKLTKVANMVMAAALPDITDSTYPAKFLAQVDQMYKEGTFPYSPGEALLRKCFPLAPTVLETICWRLPPPKMLINNSFRWNRVNPASPIAAVQHCTLLAYSPRSIAINLKNRKVVLDTLDESDPDVSDFLAITRIIQGTVKVGQSLYVRKQGYKDISVQVKIESIFIFMGTDLLPIEEATHGMVVGLGFVEANPFVDSTQTKVYGANTKVLSKDLDAWIQLIRQNRSSECTVTPESIWCDIRNITFSSSIEPYILGEPSITETSAVMKVKLSRWQQLHDISISGCMLGDRDALRRGLWRLVRTDPSVQVEIAGTGEMIVAVHGAIQLEKVLKDLENVLARVPFQPSQPTVALCETIVSMDDAVRDWKHQESLKGITNPDSSLYRENLIKLHSEGSEMPFPPWAPPLRPSLANPEDSTSLDLMRTDPGRLLRLTYNSGSCRAGATSALSWVVSAMPLSIPASNSLPLLSLIDERIGLNAKISVMSRSNSNMWSTCDSELIQSVNDSMKMVNDCFASGDDTESNTKLNLLIKEGLLAAFRRVALRGPLMGRPLRGVHFFIEAILLDETVINEYQINEMRVITDQIVKHFTKTLECSVLMRGRARIVEPMQGMMVTCDQTRLGFVHKVLDQRRSHKISEEYIEGTNSMRINIMMPLCEMSGVLQDIRSEAKGLVQMEADERKDWRIIDVDPFPEAAMTKEELEDNGLYFSCDWSGNRARELVMNQREAVGLPTGKKVVQEAEKQRTMTKMK